MTGREVQDKQYQKVRFRVDGFGTRMEPSDLGSVSMIEAINGSVRPAVGDGVVVFEGSARSGAKFGVTVAWKDWAGTVIVSMSRIRGYRHLFDRPYGYEAN